MAQFTIYRSTDGSAPTLSGTVGSLVALLDACLVNGYGAKVAAGWTKPFTGTNKAAFRNAASGTQMYWRIQDDAPGAGAAREARVTGYESMSDVDTGVNPFPTAAQGVGGIAMTVARKSATADATARAWVVIADSVTCYVFVLTADVASSYFSFCIGDFFSFKQNDAYRALTIGRAAENSASVINDTFATISNAGFGTSGLSGHFLARGHTGLAGSVNFAKHGDGCKAEDAPITIGTIPYTNPADGGLYLAPLWIQDFSTIPTSGLRGRMRGLWHFLHAVGSINDGDTASGGASGELTGKTFLFLKNVHGGGSASSAVGTIETSNTLETN